MHAYRRNAIALLVLSACAVSATGCRDDSQRDDRPEPQADAPRAATLADPARPEPMDERSASSDAVVADREFLRTALASGLAEVSMSRDVESRSPTEAVRDLAKRIAEDHEALNAKLRERAGDDADGLEMDASAKAMDTMIRSTEPAALDRAYLQHMAEGHAKSIARFEAGAANAADESVRKLANDALPTLREHAQAVEKRLAQGK